MRPDERSSHAVPGTDSRAPARARRWNRRRLLRVAAAVAVALIVLLIVGQLVLPGIAEDRVRERVGRYGEVQAVYVHAVPALELLWSNAQEISVKAGELRASPKELVDLEQNLGGVERARLTSPMLHLVISSIASGDVPLERVTLLKEGNALSVSGTVRAGALDVTLPAGFEVSGLSASSGQPEVGVSGEAFGTHVSGQAVVSAHEGKLIAEPAGLPFAGFATVTLFSDPRIYVESVTAVPAGEGVLLSFHGRSSS